MSQLRKDIIQAAQQAGDHEYAAYLQARKVMTREEMLPRARYYGIVA